MEFYEQEYKKHLEAAEAANEEGDLVSLRKNLLASVDFLVKLANGSDGKVKKSRLELAEKLLARAETIKKDAKPRPGSVAAVRAQPAAGGAALPARAGGPPAKHAE